MAFRFTIEFDLDEPLTDLDHRMLQRDIEYFMRRRTEMGPVELTNFYLTNRMI